MQIVRFGFKQLLWIFLFTVILSCKTREVNYIPYYLKTYTADSLYITGDYQKSFKILDDLSKNYALLNPIETRDLELYIKTAQLTGNYGVLKPAIKNLVSTWDYRPEHIEYDSLMKEAWKKANISEKEIQKWEEICKRNINWTLRDTLITMTTNDQIFRKGSGVDLVRDSVDISHKNLLINIFEKYGYPDFRMVGYPKDGERTDLGTIYLHIFDQLTDEEFEYYKTHLLKYIKEGKANPNYLANLVDRTTYTNEHKTIYGTYGTHISWGDKMVEFDTIEINRNRKSIGLPSVEYQQFK